MRCYFLRHGIAVEAYEFSGTDFDRPLTDAGRALMAREAVTMAAMGLDIDVIVTSPLVRTQQTAAIVAQELNVSGGIVVDERVGLNFGPSACSAVLKERREAKGVMFVGHEPCMSGTIGELIGGASVDMKKGSLACVDLATAGSRRGELAWLIPAKVLALVSR